MKESWFLDEDGRTPSTLLTPTNPGHWSSLGGLPVSDVGRARQTIGNRCFCDGAIPATAMTPAHVQRTVRTTLKVGAIELTLAPLAFGQRARLMNDNPLTDRKILNVSADFK